MRQLSMMLGNANLGPLRLIGVSGFDNRINDIVYCSPQNECESKDIAVFFGGDVQVSFFRL